MQPDIEAGLESEQKLLASAEAKLLREELRRAARNAGAADPQMIVDRFLPSAEFVSGRIKITVGGEKLSVREVVSKTQDRIS